MGSISLKKIRQVAPVGFYPAEQALKRHLEVDITLLFPLEEQFSEEKLEGTINYEQIFQLVEEVCRKPVQLLETLAKRMAARCRQQFPQVQEVTVVIRKPDPLMNGRSGTAEIVWEG